MDLIELHSLANKNNPLANIVLTGGLDDKNHSALNQTVSTKKLSDMINKTHEEHKRVKSNFQ